MQRSLRRLISLGFAASLTIAACASNDGELDAVSTDDPSATAAAVIEPATTLAALTPTPTTSTTAAATISTPNTSTSPATTAAATAAESDAGPDESDIGSDDLTLDASATLTDGSVADVAASASEVADRIGEQIELQTPVFDIGSSVEGRPIVAERLGTVGGRKVLIIGVIHGNEDAGIQIVDELRQRAIDDGVELWLIESMNPDGVARQDRHNANEVDLNRNFPHKWGPIGSPGNSQYAGTGPASEPETQVIVQFITLLRPDIAIWYHQDANLIIPSTGRDGRIRARYAELTALPLAECCGGGGVFTGIAATWARNELKKDSDAVPFIVELPGGVLSGALVDAHASAVLTIAVEG